MLVEITFARMLLMARASSIPAEAGCLEVGLSLDRLCFHEETMAVMLLSRMHFRNVWSIEIDH